jgi:uncharacterized Zn finger protein (UPF0148 family)
MGFRTYCDNKGCGKDQEPLLNLDTNEVECTECRKEIKSITSFAKSQMKNLGQIKRIEKSQQAFSVQCNFCNKSSPPKINKDGQVICSVCEKHLNNLSAPYVNLIKQKFSK